MQSNLWLVCLLVLLLPLLFWPWLYNPYAPVKFSLLVCATPLMFYSILVAVRDKGKDWFRSRFLLHIALTVEGIAFVLGTLFSIHPVLSFWGSHERKMGTVTFLACGGAALFASQVVVSPKRLKTLIRFLLWGCVASALISILLLYCEREVQAIQKLTSLDLPSLSQTASFLKTERLDGTLGNPNFFSNYLLFPSLCAVGWLGTQQSRKDRILGVLALLLSLWCLQLSNTRGAQLGFLAGILFLLGAMLFWRKGKIGYKTLGILGSLAVAVGTMLAFTFLRRTDASGSGRLLLWRDALPLLQDTWLIGTGVEGFRAAFMPYRSMELARFAPDANWRTAHNAILDTWITMGLPGLLSYFLLISAAGRGWWLALKNIGSRDKKSIPLLSACFASLVAYLSHNLFNCDVAATFFLFHLFLGMGWGLCQHLPEGRSSERLLKKKYLLWGRTLTWTLTGLLAFFAVGVIWADRAAFVSMQESRPNGNMDRAIRSGKKALKLSPWKDLYHYTFARALDRGYYYCQPERKERILDLAVEHAKIAALTPSARPEARWITLASLRFKQGRLEEALRDLDKALKVDPYFWATYRLKALILLAKGNHLEQAMESIQRASELKPGDPNVWRTYARVWDATVPFEAQEEFETGNRFLEQDQYGPAADAYRAAIQKADQKYPDAWTNLGYALERLGSLLEAEEAYRKALDLTDGYQAEANTGLSSLLIRRGKLDEALIHLKKARDIRPQAAESWKDLLVLYTRKDQRKDAQHSLNEYLAYEKDEESRRKARLYFSRHFP